MIKIMFVLAATVLCSFNAWAGYTQYNFESGHPNLSGFFVQHDDDGSIAMFDFQLVDDDPAISTQFYPFNWGGCVCLKSASTYFRNGPASRGPSNFSIQDDLEGHRNAYFNISFSKSPDGMFSFTATNSFSRYEEGNAIIYSDTFTGLVSVGPVEPMLEYNLDLTGGYYPVVPRILPTYIGPANAVPEPASLALLAIGALGIAGVARRRKAAP